MYVFNPQAPVNPNHASLAKAHGAIEETYRGPGERLQALHIKNKAALATTGKALYLVPEGASDVLGALGFVNAVGEVASQLAERGEPFPDVVYLLTGTGGSAAGFLAGLDVFGVKTQPILVALTPDAYPGQQQGRITALYAMVMEYVSLLEPSITKRNEPVNAPAYDHGFNQSSNASLQEITSTTQQLLLNQASYHLDASFGARLWGAFLLDATHGKLAHKHVMIWNTSPL
ncbi:hypothetical protein EBZ39_19775 [bacterium]|nr:hypothetical protein [bacterium]